MAKYEKIGNVEMALCMWACQDAFSKLGYSPPCLVTGKFLSGTGRRIARAQAINYRLDKTLDDCEWFIEWRGKRFGSKGR